MKSIKRILVTGATGFIGRNLVKRLLDDGYKVNALVRDPAKSYLLPQDKNLKILEGDITRPKSLKSAFDNVEVVLHLAALKLDEPGSLKVNVEGTKNLVNFARRHEAKRIVYISTMSAKIEKKGIYASTKFLGEEIIKKSGVPFVILRPSVVYSNSFEGAFSLLFKASQLPIIPVFGDGLWNSRPIHVDDLVGYMKNSITSKHFLGKSFDVGGKDEINYNDLIRLIGKKTGKFPHIIHLPVRLGLFVVDFLSLFSSKLPITKSNILGSTQNVIQNYSEIENISSYSPRKLENGLNNVFSPFFNSLNEAHIFYRYILGKKYQVMRNEDYERYKTVVKQHRLKNYNLLIHKYSLLLGAMDAVSKIFSKHSVLQKKLLVCAAIIEAHPVSASWLLPRKRPVFKIIFEIFIIFSKTVVLFFIGVLAACIPRFYKRYVY